MNDGVKPIRFKGFRTFLYFFELGLEDLAVIKFGIQMNNDSQQAKPLFIVVWTYLYLEKI
jgi:hypothetical protein